MDEAANAASPWCLQNTSLYRVNVRARGTAHGSSQKVGEGGGGLSRPQRSTEIIGGLYKGLFQEYTEIIRCPYDGLYQDYVETLLHPR